MVRKKPTADSAGGLAPTAPTMERTLPPPQGRTFGRKRKAEAQLSEPPSDLEESDYDPAEYASDADDEDAVELVDMEAAEDERLELVLTLEGSQSLTTEQANALEPCETFQQDDELEEVVEYVQPVATPAVGHPSSDRRKFLYDHLTSLVRPGLRDKLTSFIETTGNPAPARSTPSPSRVQTAPKKSRNDWVFQDPKLAEIWYRMVDRLLVHAAESGYDFDPAMLVAPSGTLDAPIILGLHWPPKTRHLAEYSNMEDMMYNPCVELLAEKFGGLDNALTLDFRPLAMEKPPNYSNRPPCADMPATMLQDFDDTLQEIMEASSAKVAVYFGRWNLKTYRNLYPKSEAIKLADIPMFNMQTHAYVEQFQSGPMTGQVRRLVVFCYHPEAFLRGVHPLQVRTMDHLCNLAVVLAQRSKVALSMLSDNFVSRARTRTAKRRGKQDPFNQLCKLLVREYQRDSPYSQDLLPKNLLPYLEPQFVPNIIRSKCATAGYDIFKITAAMDAKIRTAIRANLAGLAHVPNKGQTQPSLLRLIACRLLEEPACFCWKVAKFKFQHGVHITRRLNALQGGILELFKVAKDTAFLLSRSPAKRPNKRNEEEKKARREIESAERLGKVLTVEEKKAAFSSIKRSRPHQVWPSEMATWDPNSAAAAAWLLEKFKVEEKGRSTPMSKIKNMILYMNESDQSSFSKERRKLDTLAREDKDGTALFSYIIRIMKAHGMDVKIAQKWQDKYNLQRFM